MSDRGIKMYNSENNDLYKIEKKEEIRAYAHGNKKKGNGTFVALLLVFAVFVGYLAGVLTERFDTSNGVLQSRKMERLRELIDENYYFSDRIDHERAMENAYGMYVGSFGDDFTYYLDDESYSSMMESTTGNYVGIGVEVTVSEDNYITVTNSFKGGSAFESGIEPGDRIIAVEGVEYSGDELDDAVAVLKGHEGEKVSIKIFDFSENKEKDIEIVRRHVTLQTVDSKMLENNIAYIKISSFGNTTASEFENAYNELNKNNPVGLVLDLRNNSGGTLDSVVKVSDILMPEGEIVKIKYRNFENEVYNSDASCFDKKIIVLTNENTASASELLAGGLRDNNNAVLVGKKTFGKGVVGTMFPVDSKTAAVITTGEYFLPNGDNIHGIGIMPDIEVDLPQNVKNIYLMDESSDTQLKRALEEFN